MDLDRLKALIELVAQSGIAELEITEGGDTVRILGGGGGAPPAAMPPPPAPTPLPAPAAPPPAAGDRLVLAPMYGVFHHAPAPGAPPFVELGQHVAAGQKLGVLEAMKVFNAVLAESPGRVAAILVESGQEVELGQPLIRLA